MVLDSEFQDRLKSATIEELKLIQKEVHEGMVRFASNNTILSDLAHKYNEIDKMIEYITKYQ